MTQNPKIWKINGISLKLDLNDADDMEAYEEAFELMAMEEEELPKEGKVSEKMRAYCSMYRKLFLDIFGDEALPLFECVRDNVGYYESLYIQFLEFISTQMKYITEERIQLLMHSQITYTNFIRQSIVVSFEFTTEPENRLP